MAKKEIYQKWWFWVIIVVVFLIIVGALMPSNSSNSSSSSSVSIKNLDKNERIISPSQRQIETLEFGLVDGVSISNIYTIKSNDFANVYFVGGLLNGNGANNVVGIWVVGYEHPSLTFSINAIAKQFSDYPLGSGTDAKITMNDDGASILYSYLKTLS